MKGICLIIGALLLAATGAEAKRMTLEQCMESAVGHNPGLRAEELNVANSRTLVGTAFDAPNTEIELSQDATDGGGMENGLKFSQEFDFPTLYAARRKVLKADVEVARNALELQKTELACKIMRAYYTLAYLERKSEVARHIAGAYAEFARTATIRFDAGETSRLESLNAERLAGKSQADLNDILVEKQGASILLMTLIGEEQPVEVAEESLPILCPDELPEEIDGSFTARGRLMHSEFMRSQKNLGVARQEFLPGLFVSATSQLLIKGFNPYHVERPRFRPGNFMGFQVGVTVPLFFGAKRSRLMAAQREVEIARARMEDAGLSLRGEYAEARAQYLAAMEKLGYYEDKGLEQAREIARLAAVSYELGEIDYMEYMQNLETAASLEFEYLESINRVNQSVITLQSLR